MEVSTELRLSHGSYTFAQITRCKVFGPSKTFSGIEFTFDLKIEPTEVVNGKNPSLEKLVVDLYLIKDSAELYLGQLKDRFISPSSFSYSRDHQQHLQLDTNTFLKLVDETHHTDLELKLRVQGILHYQKFKKFFP